MKRALCLSFVLLLAASVGAEPFGAAFPVTNTRYRSAVGEPRLVANESDFFLFWSAQNKIRAVRVDDGEARVSHVVLDTNESFDVAWTGQRYLIASTRADSAAPTGTSVVARVLDAEARPAGADFTIADGEIPAVAAGEHSIAILYGVGIAETRLVLLSRNGRTIETPSRLIAPRGTTHAITRSGDGFLAIVAINGGIRAVALDQQGQTVAQSTLSAAPNVFRDVAVASEGTKSLAVWADETRVVAARIDANAGIGPRLELYRATGEHRSPTVLWNGAGWTVSYAQASNTANAKAVIVQLDPEGHAVLSREESAAGNVSPTIAALNGQTLAAWRESGPNKSPVLVELPIASQKRRDTPYTPALQTLLATATSAGATLTVWSENIEGGVSIHAGLRNLQGQWSERQLATSSAPGTSALAQSDGEGFAIAIAGSSPSVIRIDADGHPAAPLALPFAPALMRWNGSNYALFDGDGHGVLVSPSGVVSGTVTSGSGFRPTAVASDGDGFFLAGVDLRCHFNVCLPFIPVSISAVRLGPDLQKLDQEEYSINGQGSVQLVGAAWDGSSYLVIGRSAGIGSFLTYVPSSPSQATENQPFNASFEPETMLALSDGTIAVAGRVDDTTNRVAVLSRQGTFLQTSDIEGTTTGMARLEQLADGGIAFIASTIQNAAPHDGTSRIVTAIGHSSSVPLPPAAPHVSARVQNGVMRINWSAPSGTVNGYRLEYRVDDDEWVEWEEWFGPGVHGKSIRQPDFGTKFAFRVRAFNDGGAGEYSAPELTTPSRRRAVR